MKILKRITYSIISVIIICILFKVAFKVDLWSMFIYPLIKEMINTIF